MVIIQQYGENGQKLRRCDAKCYNAKGKKCNCICGAINHGKGIDFAIQNSTHLLKRIQKTDDFNSYLLSEPLYFLVYGDLFGEYKSIFFPDKYLT